MIKRCAITGREFFDSKGRRFNLGSTPSKGKLKANYRNYTDAGNPIFDQADWKEVNRRQTMPWILNQAQFSSCVGNGWVGALRRARALAGCKDVSLSPGFLYSQINGGSDNGAVISDGIDALMKTGTCSFATVGQSPIYWRDQSSAAKNEAKRYRLKNAYHCTSWAEVISAILTGRFIAVYGYQVGNSFENFDQYGVAGHDRGPGNHCNHADGVVKLPDGRWVLDDVNSWDYPWGPFQNGRVYIDEQHLFGGGDEPDVCVVEAFSEDPQEPNEPPVANAA